MELQSNPDIVPLLVRRSLWLYIDILNNERFLFRDFSWALSEGGAILGVGSVSICAPQRCVTGFPKATPRGSEKAQ
jgi:hypothetical protein